MLRRCILFTSLLLCGTLAAYSQAPAGKIFLLNIAGGQMPTDTEPEDTTKLSVEPQPDLGPKALKVLLISSFGDRQARVTNWKPFTTLGFNAVNPTKSDVKLNFVAVLRLHDGDAKLNNPTKSDVKLNFVVKHKKTTNFATRVELPFVLKPGFNEVRFDVADMANTNGARADLGNVVRWYIARESKGAVTLYFSDIWFEGGTPTPLATAPGGPAPLVGYRVKGKVGNLDVDLTVTPFAVQGPSTPTPPPAKVGSDPARLERLKKTKMPKVDKVIEFFTPEADAICSALEVYPPDNPWNLVIEAWPLHPNSKNMVASVGSDKVFRYNPDMGYIIVPPGFKKADVKIVAYPGESDKGPFPVPDNIPIEGWPGYFGLSPKTKGWSLDDVQRDKAKQGGDRHALVVDPVNRMLYEFYQMKKTDQGWQAAQLSIFDLKSNKLRPEGWTSTDAAGLPIFPATVRYDELKRGLVEHAMRVTIRKSRRAYVYPATHYASKWTDENLPRMGERFRLRQDFDISGFSPDMQAILKGLKKYGMFVADNGIEWAISVAPDPRIPDMNAEFRKLKGADFEVVVPPAGYVPPGS